MQLTDLDETLMHQTALPFEFCDTSDHRFYDRFYVSAFSPDGQFGFINGMGVYKNMNVMDGFACTRSGATQRNQRFSRALRPNLPGMRMDVGPMQAEILQPYKKARYACMPEGESDFFDVNFSAFLPPHLENHHVSRGDGRLHTNYWRQSQLGHINGRGRFGGQEVAIKDWFMWRDHSWGVRPGVGGWEPVTGQRPNAALPSAARAGGLGMLIVSVLGETPTLGCMFQVQENENGQVYYLDGSLALPGQEPDVFVTAEHDITFRPGTRLFSGGTFRLKTKSGRAVAVTAEAIGSPWCMRGAGYDSGYADGRGMGVFRGDALYVERDSYDLSTGDEILMPNGERVKPRHREQPVRITVDGEAGFAHAVVMGVGRHKRYGLE